MFLGRVRRVCHVCVCVTCMPCAKPFILDQVELTNKDESGMLHNLDFHSVFGPGGGAPLLTVGAGETKHAWFKLLHPGRYLPRTRRPRLTPTTQDCSSITARSTPWGCTSPTACTA